MAQTSGKCHSGPCGPCKLCQKPSNKYTHPVKFTDTEYEFLRGLERGNVSKDVCVCYPCSKQLKRNIGNENFQPRWLDGPKDTLFRCGVSGCKHAGKKRTELVLNTVEEIFHHPLVTFEVTDQESTVSARLCIEHYNAVYSYTHPPSPCAACGSMPRKGERFNRHCSSLDVINTYLHLVCNAPCHLTDDSIICHSCYKHFLIIIHNISTQDHNGVDLYSMGSVNQRIIAIRNQGIDKIIERLTAAKQSILLKESMSLWDFFEVNMCAIGIDLAGCMKNDCAVLLPKLYNEFKTLCMLNSTSFSSLNISESDLPTSRWLLSKLHFYFDDSLQAHCRHKRYGTMLMHKQCDVVQALSSALSTHSSASQPPTADIHVGTQKSCPMEGTTQSSSEPTEQQVVKVASYLNNKLHDQIKRVNKEFQNYDTPNENSLGQFFNISDPLLVKFLRILTQTVRQSRRSLFQEDQFASGLPHTSCPVPQLTTTINTNLQDTWDPVQNYGKQWETWTESDFPWGHP